MAYRLPTTISTVISNVTGSGGESVISTTGFIIPVADSGAILVFWRCGFGAVAGALAANFLIRRGAALTSTLLYQTGTVTSASGTTNRQSGALIDTPGAVGPVQYSLSINNITAGGSVVLTDQDIFAL